jgi:hypothetical protein
MLGPVSTSDVYLWLRQELARRPEFGLCKAVVNLVLQPPNPFDRNAARKPRLWVMLTAIFVISALSVFVYFNVIS